MLTENVTYLETLHPEEGYKALKKGENAYAGKWDAVWAEATPIHEVEAEEVQADVENNKNNSNGSNSSTNGQSKPSEPNDCQKFNFVVAIIGRSLLVGAVFAAFGLELANSIVFLSAVAFNWMAEKMDSVGGPLIIFQLIFNLVASILLLLDWMLLTLGTLLTELLGWIAFGLCTLFGGLQAGREWQQAIRRDCHLTRWAFRGFHDGWSCQRGSPCNKTCDASPSDETEEKAVKSDDNNDGTIVVGTKDVKLVDDDEEDARNMKAAQ